MFTAIPFMSYGTGFGFISSLESRGYTFSFGFFKHFDYYGVNTLFVGHLHSFTMRY
jgi:hypothetical protein